MTKPGLLPDPMPLRDALRGLRFVLHRSGESLASVLPVQALPEPAARLAGAALRDMGQLASGLEDVASDLARMALHGQAPPLPQDITATGADAFAAAFYAALRAVLARLNALPAHVSEVAIRQACLSVHPQPGETGPDRAAALSLALRAARILRGATIHPDTPVTEAQLDTLAIFAVLLSLLADRTEGEEDQLLASATDLALALLPEIQTAFADPATLSALFTRYARHV